MRRALTVLIAATGLLLVASPASAFAHNAVHSPALHALLDGLTLAVVTAPLWTAYLWGAARRGLLLALVVVVQVPVAVIGFVPIETPWLHLASFALALSLTAWSLWQTRPPATTMAQSSSVAEA